MMSSAITATGGLPNTTTQTASSSGGTPATASSSAGGLAGLTATDFLNLMVTQLQNQDPLNPTSSDSLLTQTSALSQVEGMSQLNTNLSQLLSSQQLTQAAGLIGRDVTYQATGSSTAQSGTVSAVSLVNGQAQLTIGSASVPLSQIQGIKAA
ncbi:MAG TPA: flagellar hook capping FlgD N-terminal domain-containing protein [Gemmataceae bacterium]|nr:flagellar hook capping FlgD N-terminal domain-containing protein [Gemmataceae bacterium]